ncbi:MAG: hypothetical protein LBR48_08250 [Dysgonamonadaceae bacterium]|nr:hypothetical protein [Dysgonamonadaceae bacterium]
MEDKNNYREDDRPDDDKVIYIPDKEYHSLMQSFRKLEEAQKAFHEIRDSEATEPEN